MNCSVIYHAFSKTVKAMIAADLRLNVRWAGQMASAITTAPSFHTVMATLRSVLRTTRPGRAPLGKNPARFTAGLSSSRLAEV